MIKPCVISTPQFTYDPLSLLIGYKIDLHQKCFYKKFTQLGFINTETWEFTPALSNGHRVLFYNKESFDKAKVKWCDLLEMKDFDNALG